MNAIATAQGKHSSGEPPLILTLDIGSSSVRAMLYDRAGRALGGIAAQEHYALRTAADGRAEDDAGSALARAARCIDGVLRQAGPLAAQVGAVAVATLVTSILAVDAAGRPLTPLVTYADMRSDADAAALRAALDEAEIHDRTGCLLRANYWPAQLAWFRRTQPRVWRAAARWITLGEYLELRLFGRCRVSYSAASWGGLLARRQLEWDAPLLDRLGVAPGQLSSLADTDEPLSGLAGEYASASRQLNVTSHVCPGPTFTVNFSNDRSWFAPVSSGKPSRPTTRP